MKNKFKSAFVCLFAVILLTAFSFAQTKTKRAEREMDFDEAGEEETLNREIWESVKKTRYETALRHAAKARQTAAQARPAAARATLPNGWQIAPAGAQIEVGRLPFEAITYAGQTIVLNTGYYNKEPQEVSVINPDSQKVVKVLHLPGLYPGAAVGADDDLYISGGFSQKVYRYNRNFLAVRDYTVGGYVAGLTAIDAEHLAVVYLVTANSVDDFQKGNYLAGKLAILNTKTAQIERETTVGYFPQTVKYLNGKFYVAVTGENKVGVYDASLKPLSTLQVGAKPQNSCTGGDILYVVNQNSDDLSVIDTKTDKVISTIPVNWQNSNFGAAPTSCAVENKRLYVTEADVNAVAVYDLSANRLLGYVPTGFFPTKVLFQNGKMLVVSAKGVRPRRPNVDGPQTVGELGGADYVLTLLKGSVSIVPNNQINTNLLNWTRQVQTGTPLFDPKRGFKLPIKHIFYIVRENRTYDQVLGDLPRGDGDKFLTLFGRETTPNAHQLSEDFVTLDNFYADGEISVLGHSFTTSGYASPFLEWLGNNAYSGRYSGYPFGMVPAVTSPAYLWDALDAKKIDYKIYGENYYLYNRADKILSETFGADDEINKKFYAQMMKYAGIIDRGDIFYRFAKPFYGQMDTTENASHLLENADFARAFSNFLCGDESLVKFLQENQNLRRRFAEYLTHYPANYRSWDLKVSDLERAADWQTDFENQLAKGAVAPLSYLWLPNDHTGGTNKNYLPPDQIVAQNDAALGLIVSTISKSPIWKDSLILVVEDDAQNGPDHVDATRTVALAVGPYVKRNTVVSNRYDQLSLLRTIELSLGLAPLNLNDALAVPMFDIFTNKPDFRPFEPLDPAAHLSEEDRKLYENFATAK
ncbi:MAG: bifunctional YncE family protein/alkaline phosphatase family protein [Acidobacteriota bacterium]|nr:bifunctional YncE family protein/alkaline phosphatase family protein [Acidobacteriota bacterium]